MSTVVVFGSAPRSLVKVRRPIIQALRAAGHRVLACAPEIPPEKRRRLAQWDIESVSIPMERQGVNPFNDLKTLYSLYDLFRSLEPDKVLSYNAKPVVYGSLAAWSAGAEPYAWITGLGRNYTVDTPRTRLIRGVMSVLYRVAFTVCDTVFFQNEDDFADLRRRNVLPERISTCITNGSGVDTEHFAQAPLPEKPVYLCLARLVAEKGVREYVQAARQVKQEYPEATFLLAGDLEPAVPNAVSQDELNHWIDEGVIEYLGYVDDVRPAIARASTYVLPTYREGTPRSILEAMSMGRPVITTDAPGARETVREGKNGWRVPPRNAQALADAMRWMIQHPDEREIMGEKSRARVEKKYDVELINKTVMEKMGCSPAADFN